MRASPHFTNKQFRLMLISMILILNGCAPTPPTQSPPIIPETGSTQGEPTQVEPTAAATKVAATEPPLTIALTPVKFAAKVFKGGETETEVEQDETLPVEPDDRIEVVKLDDQKEQSHSILDFPDFLQVELFTNAVVLLQDVREEAGGSTHVTLNLSRGHMFVELTDETSSRVTVETPDATINTLEDGTEFRICKAPDSLTCTQVKKGSVEVIAEGKKEIVRAGEASFIFKDEPPSSIICAPNEIFSDWEEQYRKNVQTATLGAMVAGLRELCGWQSLELPPNARELYNDDFMIASTGWLQERNDDSFVGYTTPEYYHIQVQRPGEKVVVNVPGQRTADNVNIDLRAVTGVAKAGDFRYGVLFRQLEDQYYGFAISPNTKTWYVLRGTSDGEEILAEGTNDSLQGLDVEDTLRVIAKDSLATFFINGQLVYQLSNVDKVRGTVGLFVETVDSPSALIYFDSITMWDIQGPQPNSTPLTKENCFNNRDDDGDHFVDRDDPDCNTPDILPTLAPQPTFTENPPTVPPGDTPTDPPPPPGDTPTDPPPPPPGDTPTDPPPPPPPGDTPTDPPPPPPPGDTPEP